MLPSFMPYVDSDTQHLTDGSEIPACDFCKSAINTKVQCRQHYASLRSRPEGYYQCPFGFTTRSFFFSGRQYAITGVIAFPRFDTENERRAAKKFPAVKVSRDSVERFVAFLKELDRLRADQIQEAAKVFPQAFHELRKLNGAILQLAERESERGESSSLLSIRSAAELMRNNFDILEALSNIDGMKAIPSDSTVNVFDLLYKTKRILQERASARSMHVQVNGQRAIVRGSQKSFPIVPAVLMENAIKYGIPNTTILADVSVAENRATMTMENSTKGMIDPQRCFDRGVRFSNEVEGGGFGLFLAKEIVTAHNGTITCQASAGRVKMTVELPLLTVIPGY